MEPDPVLNDPRYVALAAENAALRTEMASLREAMERLEKLLEALQGKLSKDSHNSHKPPGSDGPQAPPRPLNPPTGRKRGGQPGRKGKAREPLPEGSEKRTVEVKLRACPHCACAIPPEAITGTVTHRVLDLVKDLTEVIAFRLDESCCPRCHKAIRGPFGAHRVLPLQHHAGLRGSEGLFCPRTSRVCSAPTATPPIASSRMT